MAKGRDVCRSYAPGRETVLTCEEGQTISKYVLVHIITCEAPFQVEARGRGSKGLRVSMSWLILCAPLLQASTKPSANRKAHRNTALCLTRSALLAPQNTQLLLCCPMLPSELGTFFFRSLAAPWGSIICSERRAHMSCTRCSRKETTPRSSKKRVGGFEGP